MGKLKAGWWGDFEIQSQNLPNNGDRQIGVIFPCQITRNQLSPIPFDAILTIARIARQAVPYRELSANRRLSDGLGFTGAGEANPAIFAPGEGKAPKTGLQGGIWLE